MKEDSDDATVRGSEDRPTEAARISSDADRIERAFAGESIYGDDFTPDEILAWFKDEAEAYADLGAKDAGVRSNGGRRSACTLGEAAAERCARLPR